MKLFGLCIAIFTHSLVLSQTLIPDSLFATNSTVQTSLGASDESSKLLLQPDGKILFGGYDFDGSCNCFRNTMMRIDACGTIDATFGVNGKVIHTFSQRNIAHDYALQPDGKIVVTGMQAPSNAGSQQIPFVGRYNADGSVDDTFATGGTNSLRFDPVSSGRFFSTIVMDDGRILCVGVSSSNINGGVNGIGAMRFLSDGNVDPTFSGDGITRLPIFGNKAFFGSFSGNLLKDGRIICVGTTTLNATFTNQMAAAAFDSTGAIDVTFGTGGYFEDPEVTAGNRVFSATQSDEKIVFGADLLGNASVMIKRLTNLGTFDLSFGSSGSITLPYANGFGTLKGIKILSNDKILLFINNLTAGTYTLHQLTRDGVTDTGFGINGVATIFYGGSGQQYFNQAIEYPNGDLVVGGVRNSDVIISRLTENSNVPHLTNVCASLNSNVNNPGITYQWFVDGAIISLANTSTHTATQNGSYTVEVTDNTGCKKLSNTISLSVEGPSVSPGASCGPGSITLTASGGTNGQYRWYTDLTGGTAIAGETNSSFTTPLLSASTNFYVAINNGACESARTPVEATINGIPESPVITASITPVANALTICSTTSLMLTAPTGFSSYSWSTGATTPQITISASGTYFVTGTDAAGCVSPASVALVVTVLPAPCNNQAPVINTTTSSTVIGGLATINLLDLISDADNNLITASLIVVQQPGSGATATITNGVLEIDYTGISFSGRDQLTIEVCDAFGECTQQDLTVDVVGDITVYNAISPNTDDDLNSILTIQYINVLPDTEKNRVTIFNRWGDVVWEGSDYDNSTVVFDGTNTNGKELPTGTYFYKIEFTSGRLAKTGYLSLKR